MQLKRLTIGWIAGMFLIHTLIFTVYAYLEVYRNALHDPLLLAGFLLACIGHLFLIILIAFIAAGKIYVDKGDSP